MVKKQIEAFLLEKPGYLKKSPLETAKALWKISNTQKTKKDLAKDIELVRTVQVDIRQAKSEVNTKYEQKLIDVYEEIQNIKNRPKKILYLDIEVSPNIGLFWRSGYEIKVTPDDIIQERAIICVCWKWDGEKTVHSLSWNKGDDKELCKKFSKIIDEADIVCTQNGDSFDIKWLRTRCLYHNIPFPVKLNSIDTLKLAKANFYFNSNKLDYMGKFTGVGGKIDTTYSLWKDILLKNCTQSMNKMIEYCKIDVVRLEEVYKKLKPYVPEKKFKFKAPL